jgi:hypothetical protein
MWVLFMEAEIGNKGEQEKRRIGNSQLFLSLIASFSLLALIKTILALLCLEWIYLSS